MEPEKLKNYRQNKIKEAKKNGGTEERETEKGRNGEIDGTRKRGNEGTEKRTGV